MQKPDSDSFPVAAKHGVIPLNPKYNKRVGEFDLIEEYFAHGPTRDDLLLGIGDDAALVDAGEGNSVICALACYGTTGVDARVPEADVLANDLVCAAFNRLASRGIVPAWYTLALCLPAPRDDWLKTFSGALFAAASPCGAALVGGDTTRGPFAATLVAHGPIRDVVDPDPPPPTAGSAIYVTGELGRRPPGTRGAPTTHNGIAHRPVPPRVEAGITAFAHVSAAADIRLSLAATLTDMLEPYELGARLESSALPVAAESAQLAHRQGGAKLLAETATDPELCFIVAPDREPSFCRAMEALSTSCTRIGAVSKEPGVQISDARH